ncbi:penicillin acylase family protein [Cecembia calidifontis]|uniref:Penicillin amidase n=1 Tax=Cecembia calidifontis TaxID=1187080 RepID=A0A4Q7P915_9BACT|nr:penicillin acylase family protein [Cecembia calidifontis]RZS96686.1 penicillin amidase [Cecembia calidifontis]
MRYIAFFLSLIITVGLAVLLSIQVGTVPPLGLLLDPNHGFWQNAYSEDMIAKETIKLNNLKEPVRVVYDEHLIPHVFAQNEVDLYRVQGYVTAQHRLWQMEFQTMAAAGRISEIVGPVAIELDRMTRRKGLAYSAEQAVQYIKNTDPEIYTLIEAYTDGVNQYIDGLSSARLPLEYKILAYRPENWSVYKSLLLLKYMADMLVGDKDLEYTNMRQTIGDTLLDKLYPLFPEDNDPVIEAERVWDFEPIPVKKPEGITYPDDKILLKTLPQPEPGVGSNNWAVAPGKTRNGAAILANDPHLSLNLPSLWYAMQLSTPQHTVKGATLPGALGIISGFNENIAWGVTNATRDTRDWYSIQFKDESRTEYLYNDRWIQSTFRVEEIKVKGKPSFMDTVVYTHHGPVVFDRTFRGDRQDINFALKWTAHLESNEQKTFLLLNKGKNHDDYLSALNFFTSPAQNFVFASRTGDIAMKVQGRFPLKWEGQGKFLMDGNNPAFEWQGYIPFEQNPSTFNPERGFVSSANQHSTSPSYPYYMFDDSFEHYRNRRLNNILRESENITIDDMKRLQFDQFHLHASEALPVMLHLLEKSGGVEDFGEEGGKYLEQLIQWNYYTFPNQEEPALFQTWWKHLYKLIWSQWENDSIPVVLPNKYQTVKLLYNEPESQLFDMPNTPKTEVAMDLVRQSFGEMVKEIKDWEENKGSYDWAAFKGTRIMHLVPNFESFSRRNIYTGGYSGILNATSERHGASWRYVVEMGDKITAFGIYPGGQSGNPGSKYYDNFIKIWANGDYVNFNLRKTTDNQEVLFVSTFTN